MSETTNSQDVKNLIDVYSSEFDYNCPETAIILAAGHGKRIKSHTSKMLHKIWGVPTVERVYEACRKGFEDVNIINVVGIKAADVIQVIGNRKNTLFAHQEVQNGTGHAVQVGLELIETAKYHGVVYILAGDMGLLDAATMKMFKDTFHSSGNDMMVLTGLYSGDPMANAYGRIISVKDTDINGNPSDDKGTVLEIKEYKDILALSDDEQYVLEYNGKKYGYTRRELLENNEFNSGVYAFKYDKLMELINELKSDNAQNEIYITDLISLFNKKGYGVGSVYPEQQHVIMGFNNKSVLKEMDNIARNLAYDKVKDIVMIEDPDDFFIADEVIEDIVKMDNEGIPLDIKVGKGVHIGKGVKLNYNLELGNYVYVSGNVVFGKNVKISKNVHLSCFDNQKLELGNNVTVLWGDIIKGNITIGENSIIESSVNVTGSDDYPVRIGSNVQIKGTSYVFGSTIEDDIMVEHSILVKKRIEKLVKRNGKVQAIKYYIPMPEGIDAVEDIE